MGPEKWKGELPKGAEESDTRTERKEPGQAGAPQDAADLDPREEDGWSQPESSAQKGVESPNEEGEGD
jgi:hypothetical protein